MSSRAASVSTITEILYVCGYATHGNRKKIIKKAACFPENFINCILVKDLNVFNNQVSSELHNSPPWL